MSMTTPIVDFVRSYAQSGTARLHMPGHKGQSLLGFEPLDITEICGADELYAPEGIIAESEANATRLFGTAHSYYSTEGSSQCIRAMLFLALQGAPQNGKRPVLLAARNAHKALLYAAALLDFDIQWLWPAPQDAGALCSCPVSAAKLTGALQGLAQQGKRPFGVYITSPDYLGGVQDIAALAEVCKDFGVPLLVDNAHGAYLRFLPQGGQHPIALGAAMCCDSGHKTLPVVTGGAYLHLGKNAPIQDEAAVRNALALFGSTSPSYLILQSLDKCNQVLSEGYPLRLLQCCGHLTRLRREIPGVVIRTTFIVGFPGETEEDFRQLSEFMQQQRFDHAGVFTYSREEGTPAYDFPDQIDEQEKERRRDILMKQQMLINAELNEQKIGRTVEVLCEDYDPVSESCYGRSAADAPEIDGKVFFRQAGRNRPAPGDLVKVCIEDVVDYDMYGKQVLPDGADM